MRDIALTVIFFGMLPFVLSRPFVGVYIWSWLGYMNIHRATWGFAFDLPFAQIIAIVTLISLIISREPKRIPWTRETVLLLIFILWMFLTTFFSFYPDYAWLQWDKVWKIQVMVFVTLMLINTQQKLDWLIWVIVLSLGFYGVKGGIFTILTGGEFRVQGPVGSFISGNNELGLALIMTIPLMRYLQLQAKSKWMNYGLIMSMILTSIAVIGTQSRGSFVGVLAMGVFLFLKGRNKFMILLIAITVAGSVLIIMPQAWYERMATIETFQEDGSAMGRINAWRMAFQLASHNITGGGFETFKPGAFKLYAPDPDNVHDSHSIYFEVMGEHGFIGFFLFMLLALFTWNTGSRIKRQADQNAETKWAADLSSMTQVSLVGFASGGAFLGLAYFDYYYSLIAIIVICRQLLLEQVSALPAMLGPVVQESR